MMHFLRYVVAEYKSCERKRFSYGRTIAQQKRNILVLFMTFSATHITSLLSMHHRQASPLPPKKDSNGSDGACVVVVPTSKETHAAVKRKRNIYERIGTPKTDSSSSSSRPIQKGAKQKHARKAGTIYRDIGDSDVVSSKIRFKDGRKRARKTPSFRHRVPLEELSVERLGHCLRRHGFASLADQLTKERIDGRMAQFLDGDILHHQFQIHDSLTRVGVLRLFERLASVCKEQASE